MSLAEETIDATLEADGQLKLSHAPQLPPGPVEVTIRVSGPKPGKRGLSDVVREIAAEQRTRGFAGRSSFDIQRQLAESEMESEERDAKLDAARGERAAGAP